MKVKLISDVHTEFHRDKGASFFHSIDLRSHDVLVLAGDIGDSNSIIDTLCYIEQSVGRAKPWIYIPGNHEYYGSTFEQVQSDIKGFFDQSRNGILLNNEFVYIKGQRFIGSTLWYKEDPLGVAYRNQVGDFIHIKELDHSNPWMFRENTLALEFLDACLKPDDILVTHMLPSYVCVDQNYQGSMLNQFFVCEMGSLIAEREVKLAMHGHTHESVDRYIGNTRVVCNPFGYVGVELNSNYSDEFVIEV